MTRGAALLLLATCAGGPGGHGLGRRSALRQGLAEKVGMGTLYLVATPIGNLEDMTPRAIRVLREVALIAAEDTRRTGRLLSHFGIGTPMLSYHAHNERGRRDRLLEVLAGGDVALVTDAGTPGISDPGVDLVRAAAASGFAVSPVPGASALAAAVGVSGLVEGPFVVLGFLPRGGVERRRVVASAGTSGLPVVLFESPERLAKTLAELAGAWGDRPAAVARELTKLHEEILRGTLSGLAERMREAAPRGEIVLVVGGGAVGGVEVEDEVDVERLLTDLRRSGLSPSQAAREAAQVTGRPRSELYRLASTLGRDPGVRRLEPPLLVR